MVTGWRHIWSWRVYQIDPPNCWMLYRWPVGCIKREENDINSGKPSIHKAAVSGINETFPRFSWTYSLIIFHQPGLDKSCAQCTATMSIYSCVCQKIQKPKHFCMPFSPLHIALSQLSVLVFAWFFFTTNPNNCLFCEVFFTIEIEKIPYATLHEITHDRYFT